MIITNARFITWTKPNRILENQAVLIKGSRIVDIGAEKDILENHPGEEKLDAHQQYVMPGNICAHTHFYGAFSRGLAIPGDAPVDFVDILKKLWFPLDRSLTLEDVRYSALVCLIDAIKHGTTTLFDHHASSNAIDGSLDEIAQAVDESGLRASLCYEVSDRDGSDKAKAGIRENVRFNDYIQRERPLDGRLSASFGLHASLTLSEQILAECREAAPAGTGFHIHVAEHPIDEEDCQAKYGLRVVDRLHRHGILGQKSIVCHAVHIDGNEMKILSETRTWVTHQPRSNMNNGVGVSQVEKMMKTGIKVALGNDGFSNAMWEEWKTAYLVHKLYYGDPRRMTGTDLVEMAVYNNAQMTSGLFFDGKQVIGVIAPGAQADLIFVDYDPYTPLTADNLPWHIVFGFRDSMVMTMIVAGKVLMHDRELLTLDEEKINRQARKIVPSVWNRYQNQFQ